MIYLAATAWLLLIALLAWAVRALWLGVVQSRVLNLVLLPGTLVAQIGYIVGLLITGAGSGTVSVLGDEPEPDEKEAEKPAGPHTSVIGAVIIGFLTIAAVGATMQVVLYSFGGARSDHISAEHLALQVPDTLPAFWEQVRQLVTLTEETLEAFRNADAGRWADIVFIYLMVCLAVRMAPVPGNIWGHFGAIVAQGAVLALVGTVIESLAGFVSLFWPLLALVTGLLLLLLLFSALARGCIVLVSALA